MICRLPLLLPCEIEGEKRFYESLEVEVKCRDVENIKVEEINLRRAGEIFKRTEGYIKNKKCVKGDKVGEIREREFICRCDKN